MRTTVCRGSELSDRDPASEVTLVLVFAQTDALTDASLSAELRRAFPRAEICGCSSGGQILDDDILDDDPVVAGFAFDRTTVRLATETVVAAGSTRRCGEVLGRRLAGADLAAVLVVADGLWVGGNELVEGLVDGVGPGVTIVGGLAADREDFTHTRIVVNGEAGAGGIAAIGFYGPHFRMRTDICTGWQVFGPHRRVTRSAGNRVHELDGEPIVSLYRRYLDDEDFAGLPHTGLLFPLQIWPPDDPEKATIRAVLDMDRAEGALIFGGDIPEGSIARLMRGTFERLVDDAGRAAHRAMEEIPAEARSRHFALVISCIGRRLLMGSRIDDEVLSIGEVLGEMPRAGFYSLGEICRPRGSKCAGLQNESTTIAILSEEG
jgi:hypothetical protein